METMSSVPAEYVDPAKERELNTDLVNFQNTAAALVVDSQDSMDRANTEIAWISDRQKKVEAFRVAIVKPFKDHLKRIDGYFNGWIDKFDAPRKVLLAKVQEYRAAQAALARKVERVEGKAAAAPIAPAKTSHSEAGRVTYVKRYEFTVVDEKAVPWELWDRTLSKKRLNDLIKASGKDLKVGASYATLVPGIKIVVTETPMVA